MEHHACCGTTGADVVEYFGWCIGCGVEGLGEQTLCARCIVTGEGGLTEPRERSETDRARCPCRVAHRQLHLAGEGKRMLGLSGDERVHLAARPVQVGRCPRGDVRVSACSL